MYVTLFNMVMMTRMMMKMMTMQRPDSTSNVECCSTSSFLPFDEEVHVVDPLIK